MATTENCSKCEEALDTVGYPKWCKACRAKYKREYETVKIDLIAAKGFAQGVETAISMLSLEFARHGRAMLSGREVEFAIRNAPRPQYRTD